MSGTLKVTEPRLPAVSRADLVMVYRVVDVPPGAEVQVMTTALDEPVTPVIDHGSGDAVR